MKSLFVVLYWEQLLELSFRVPLPIPHNPLILWNRPTNACISLCSWWKAMSSSTKSSWQCKKDLYCPVCEQISELFWSFAENVVIIVMVSISTLLLTTVIIQISVGANYREKDNITHNIRHNKISHIPVDAFMAMPHWVYLKASKCKKRW